MHLTRLVQVVRFGDDTTDRENLGFCISNRDETTGGASCSFGHPPLNRVTKLDRLLFQDVIPNSYDLRERYFLSLSS